MSRTSLCLSIVLIAAMSCASPDSREAPKPNLVEAREELLLRANPYYIFQSGQFQRLLGPTEVAPSPTVLATEEFLRFAVRTELGFLTSGSRPEEAETASIVKQLRTGLSVTRKPDSEIIVLHYRDADGKRASKIASALAAAFERFWQERRREQLERRENNIDAWIDAQVRLQQDLELKLSIVDRQIRDWRCDFPIDALLRPFSNALARQGLLLTRIDEAKRSLDSLLQFQERISMNRQLMAPGVEVLDRDRGTRNE